MDQNNGELDRILEEGLATYSSREPWPGLEERVLSRVAHAAPKRRMVQPWALIGILAAACLLLTVLVTGRKQELRPVPVSKQLTEVPPEPAHREPPSPAPPVRQRVPARKTVQPSPDVARQQQFPTPTPLTPEERALISLAILAPAEAQPAFGEPAPIEVEPIQIEPLETSGPSEEKFQ